MKAYFISLKERTPHRYRYIVRHLRERGFEPVEVPAVDGARLTPEERETLANLPALRSLGPYSSTDGTIGCALSHLNAYRLIIESGDQWGLIFEDDVQLAPDALEIAQKAVRHMGEYSLFLLSYDFEVYLTRHLALPIKPDRTLYLPMNISFGAAHAYIIGRKAAECILKINVPVCRPADDWKYFYQKGCFKEIRLLYPPMVEIKGFRSTILPYEHSPSYRLRGKILDVIDRLNIPVLTKLTRKKRAALANKMRLKATFYDEQSPLFTL